MTTPATPRAEALDAIAALRRRRPTELPLPHVERFLLAIDALARDPGAAAERAALRAELEPALRAVLVDLAAYPGDLVLQYLAPWEGGEWPALCRRRSALAFLLELVRDTAAGAELAADLAPALDELDEQLRAWAAREAEPPIAPDDPGLPRTHWWWWHDGTAAAR